MHLIELSFRAWILAKIAATGTTHPTPWHVACLVGFQAAMYHRRFDVSAIWGQ